jgi:hypothetical protein
MRDLEKVSFFKTLQDSLAPRLKPLAIDAEENKERISSRTGGFLLTEILPQELLNVYGQLDTRASKIDVSAPPAVRWQSKYTSD